MLKSYNFAPVVAFALTLGAAAGQVAAQYTGPVAVAQHTESVAKAPPPVENQLIASVTGGAALNSGNTRAYTVTVGGHLGLIRNKNQLVLDVLGLVNATRPFRGPEPDQFGPYEKTAANVIGKARYDRFLSQNDALFAAIVPRRDVFAGLDLRMQMQAGYSRNLYSPSEKQRLWTEAGYDLTYDRFSELTTTTDVVQSTTMMDIDGVPSTIQVIQRTTSESHPDPDFINSARLFLGYSNSMTALAVVNLGAEILFDVTDGSNVRINTVADFTTSLSTRFKLGFASRVFYDHVPVAGKGPTDFVSTMQVIYTYDSLEGMKKGAAACDCTANVQKATEEAQAACAKQGGSPVPNESALQEPAGVQMPTTTTTPNATAPAPSTPAAATTPVTPPVVAPTSPQVPVAPSTTTAPAPAPATPAKP